MESNEPTRRHSSVLEQPARQPVSAGVVIALVVAVLLGLAALAVYLIKADQPAPEPAVVVISQEVEPVETEVSPVPIEAMPEEPVAAAEPEAPVPPPAPRAEPRKPQPKPAAEATRPAETPRMSAAAAGRLGRQIAEARAALADGDSALARSLAQGVLDQDPGNRQARIVLRQASQP